MKRIIAVSMAVVLAVTLGAGLALADKPTDGEGPFKGNGAPSGPHYNLNLIGVPKDKTADGEGSSGHRIFVDLDGKTRILLQQGDFQVLDYNGTDGRATFQLPAPDPENDGITAYSVYARAVGKPGGWGNITSGFTDSAGNTWLSTDNLIMMRDTGKPKFDNVSRQLLYVYADTDGDGKDERYPLFSDPMAGYFWDYDNHGLKVVQLRFYEITTDVN